MSNTDFQESDIPPELMADWQRIQRIRRVAEAMGQTTPLRGQMVGRFYVPPSPVQGIANVSGQLMGAWQNNRADKQNAAFRQKYGEMEKAALAQAQTGAPEAGLSSPFPGVRKVADARMQREIANARANAPTAAMKNTAAFEQMTPEQQTTFMGLARPPATLNLGDRVMRVPPAMPGAGPEVYAKGVTPGQSPDELAAAAEAKAAGAAQGKSDVKLRVDQPKAKLQMDMAMKPLSLLKAKVTELMDHAGLSHITGSMAGHLPTGAFIADQDGSNALALYESISNKLSGAALQAMRDASKTGGAVGQVTEREWPRLRDMLSTLARIQDAKTFKGRLQEVASYIDDINGMIARAYEETYGAAPAEGAMPQVIDFTSLPPGK